MRRLPCSRSPTPITRKDVRTCRPRRCPRSPSPASLPRSRRRAGGRPDRGRACARCRSRSRAPSPSGTATSVAEMADRAGRQAGKADHRRTLPAAGDGPRIVVVGLGVGRADPGGPAAGGRRRRTPGRGPGRGGPLSVAVALGQHRARRRRRRWPRVRCSAATATRRSAPSPDDRTGGIGAHHRGARRRGRARRRRRPRPESVARAVADRAGVGQHPGQPALPGVLRRPGPRSWSAGTRIGVDVLDEKALSPGRLRRSAGRRRRLVPAAAAGPAELPAARGQGPPGAGRQGDHLRHRRAEPQAGRGHVHHEVRHGRRRGGARRHLGDRPARAEDQGHRVRRAGREHAVGDGVPALGRADHVRRQDRGERQLRRRGPAGDGRRAGPRRPRTSRTWWSTWPP